MSAESPVAIIGIGCKFPGGADNKDLYYEFLKNKGDGMVQPPHERWNHDEWYGGKDEPGKYHTTKLGFVNGVDQFDPLEFGISVKEAACLDPAIRLALEVAHAALQDSGIDYRGSNTGVFFGNLSTTVDELDDDRYEIDSYNGVGHCVSIRANRISFTFDLRGPSLTVDTACSATATALHLALCSIRLGEIEQALVVGANTIINPEHTVSFSKLGVLSPTGSCKSFDVSADGYARAEGVAAVFIKKLDRALEDGDIIYSVIKGSAVNANGKGMSLTMPDGDVQSDAIKTAYQVAKRVPSETFFVELHATGTKVGDPIEVNAAGRVFSEGREAHKPLRVGSVKSNIGHTEGCSFLASLIKVSLMLHHREIIPNIRYTKASPMIDFPTLKMLVQTELEGMSDEMAAKDGVWVTSISSYGLGGSNAHVVLESAETIFDLSRSLETPVKQKKPLYLFSIGALTESTLTRWKEALMSMYDGAADDRVLRSVARELGRQTRAYPIRAFAVGPSLDVSINFSKPILRNSNASPKLCLVFAGQGPQHIFMGRQLAERYTVFLSSIQECDRILVEKYGQDSMLERTGLFDPGLECKLPAGGIWPVQEVVLSVVFIQVALVDLVTSLGIKYDFVVGHSIGEIAMGYASCHYNRETAVGIAVARAAAMTCAEGNGTMVALGVDVQKVKKMIHEVLSGANATSGLWIAAINSPQAVTVAGTHQLIDALIKVANDSNDKVFAAKLRVTCAFHSPLMEPQEQIFKERIAATPLSQATKTPIARVMSTTDGKWLDRDMDVNYCWDNIRRPVLFGIAINKIVSESGADGVRFLEIGPHPVLKAYVEQCGGESITLIRRPNPKVPEQNTGEHYQFLEGIGHLLSTGFKNVDFDKLHASPDGVVDFVKPTLPEYPYNRSHCWQESGKGQSERLRQRPRPLAPPHFRVNADTHPDLTGHIIFDAVLFPASGYIESILENGAMVVDNVIIHKPLVLNDPGSGPGHVGCVINGDKWEFRAAITPHFDNGTITLDSVHASGSFSRINPGYCETALRTFNFQAKLSRSTGSVTGDEFYEAIPAAYRYQRHFRNYLKIIHQVDDEVSAGGRAYLVYLEVPEGTPDVFGQGYTIHPGILDSITQCGLAMFINMDTKQFDFNGVLLPVGIDAVRRWDSLDAPDLDSEIRKGIWTYLTVSTWAPGGPFKSDYVISNSEGKVLLTVEGFEVTRVPDAELVPITDSSHDERLTIMWQPKSFFLSLDSLSSPSCLCSVFKSLGRAAAVLGRKVVRVADVAKNSDIAADLDATLCALTDESGVLVEYFCLSDTPSAADEKTATLRYYPHARSLVLDSWNLGEDTTNTSLASFDVVVHHVDLAVIQADLGLITNLVGSGGVVLLSITDSGSKVEDTSVESLTLSELVERFSSIAGSVVRVSNFVDGKALLYVKITEPTLCVPASPSKTVVIHPFEHGRERDIVEIVKYMSSEAELWITGNDDAAGIGALGISSSIMAEFPEYQVFSVLFEDHTLDEAARKSIVHDLRKNNLLLELHMKISKNGDVLVRRLVHGGAEVNHTVRTDPTGQLFDPHKTYILVGGCSELGVRLSEWMGHCGARHIFLTSRRGQKGLTKVDDMYIESLRSAGVQVEVVAADANDKSKTATVIARAKEAGQIGGIFVMTLVLRDGKFSNMTQQAFDDVYQSKITVLNTLLGCIDPSAIDFMLLFSSYASVFGNAGQAAYSASQLYMDRIVDQIPNCISVSLPPITDSGIFKRLARTTNGRVNATQLAKLGMKTAQVFNFIGDALIRKIGHYVPMLDINKVPETLPACEPRLYEHLLSKQYLARSGAEGNERGDAESPASLLAALLSVDVEQISDLDNVPITSFGLDSIGATRYSNQLRARIGIQVSQIELLGSMTIASLNKMLTKVTASVRGSEDSMTDNGAEKYGHALVPILNGRLAYGESYTTDASPSQYRIHLVQLERDNARKRAVSKTDASMAQYGATHWDTHEGHFVVVGTETPFDTDRMSEAIKEVIRRHGSLRTTFAWDEELGKLQQTIHPDVDFKTILVDLSGMPDSTKMAYEMSLALNNKPNFKLDRLPLLIAAIFNLGENLWAFGIVAHHIIMDEASIGIFFHEMFKIYLEGSQGLADVAIHYSDFSDWLLKTSEHRAKLREQHMQFWSETLDGAGPLHLGLATPSKHHLSPITQIEARISACSLERYMTLTSSVGATPYAGFFAVYNILLHKYSSQSAFVIGTAITQRNLPMLTGIIGFFANMLPIRTTIDETETFIEYLKSFEVTLVECLVHDEVPYEDLFGLGKSSSTSREYFKHLFALGEMNMEVISQLSSEQITITTMASLPNAKELYELFLTVHPSSGLAILRFDNHLYTEEAARQFLDAYISLVEILGNNPHSRIQHISMVNEAECHRHIAHPGVRYAYLSPVVWELSSNHTADATGQDTRAITEPKDTDADTPIEVLLIKKEGIQPRVFLVHDITGDARFFMQLGMHIPHDVYAIGDKHFGSPVGFSTIESMADHYITLVKGVQPQGPYVIAGYSFGGLVALSMADKLSRAGETVEHLVLLDSIYIPVAERQSRMFTNWTQHLIDRILSNVSDVRAQWKDKLRIEIGKNMAAMLAFEPPHYDGRSTLIVPTDRSWYRSGNAGNFDIGNDDHNSLDCRLKNLDMRTSGGSHDTMFAPPHVKVLAGVMKEILAAHSGHAKTL